MEETPWSNDHSRPIPSDRPEDFLVARVARTIARYAMVNTGERVLVGVSGGADSVALLDILSRLAAGLDMTLVVAHLDHGRRPADAAREADLVRRLAVCRGWPCHVETLPPLRHRGSLEAQLRRRRYAFFQRTAAAWGCTRIAVGHHADDNAETVLLNLLRGSGSAGLSGIPPVRQERIVRPLIEVARDDLRSYLRHRGLPHLEDASNTDLRFQRNKVRHHLLPLLQNMYNPDLKTALNRLAKLCRQEEAWLATLLAPVMQEALIAVDADALLLDPGAMVAQPRPAQRRLLRMALRQWQGHLRRLSVEHIDAVADLLPAERVGRGLDLPYRIRVQRMAETLKFEKAPRGRGRPRPMPSPSDYAYVIEALGAHPVTLFVPEGGGTLHLSKLAVTCINRMPSSDRREALFDLSAVVFPLVVRNARPGDRLRPMGLQGSQKVKKCFPAQGVSAQQRRQQPLVVGGSGEILWVAGVRRGITAPLTAATRQVLQMKWRPAGEPPN